MDAINSGGGDEEQFTWAELDAVLQVSSGGRFRGGRLATYPIRGAWAPAGSGAASEGPRS